MAMGRSCGKMLGLRYCRTITRRPTPSWSGAVILWVLNSGNKTGLNEIISMVEDVRKANDKILNDEEKRFGQLKINIEK